jgi:Na+/proline symporter
VNRRGTTGTIIALAATIVIALAGWAITAPLLVHLVGVFDKRWSPSDPEGLGYIIYSIAGMILAVPVWIWLAYRAYRLIKRHLSPLGNPQ